MAAGKGLPTPWRLLKKQVFLGSEDFVERHMALTEGQIKLSEIPSSQRRLTPKPLVEYEKSNFTRNEAIYAAYLSGGYNLQEIGDHFELHYPRASRIIAETKKSKRQGLTAIIYCPNYF